MHTHTHRCGEQLETLELSNCPAVDDTVLHAIAHTCVRLKFLAINNVQGISDKALQCVVQHISSLKMLEVSFMCVRGGV